STSPNTAQFLVTAAAATPVLSPVRALIRSTAAVTTTACEPNHLLRPTGVASTRSPRPRDRKSTRLNSSHVSISYAVFCLQKNQVKIEYIRREYDANQKSQHRENIVSALKGIYYEQCNR